MKVYNHFAYIFDKTGRHFPGFYFGYQQLDAKEKLAALLPFPIFEKGYYAFKVNVSLVGLGLFLTLFLLLLIEV